MIHLFRFTLPRPSSLLPLAAAGLFLSLPFISGERLSVSAAVVINEIYPKPNDEISEWVELYNTGSENVSLNQWKIENTNGEKKEYIMNASNNIAPHGFLTLLRSQTNITLSDTGDTVNLYDMQGSKVDSQAYLSTVGISRSVGRSTDGTGPWSYDCIETTKDAPNKCVAPTSTPTPLPTEIPAPPPPTNAPADAEPPVVPVEPLSGISVALPKTLGAMHTPTPTALPPDVIKIDVPNAIIVSKTTIAQILIVAISWGILAIGAMLQKKHMQKKRKIPSTETK